MYNTLRGVKKLMQEKYLNFDLKYMRCVQNKNGNRKGFTQSVVGQESTIFTVFY